jgi:hypothetical protein
MRDRALHPRQQTPVICIGSNAPCWAHTAAVLQFLGLMHHKLLLQAVTGRRQGRVVALVVLVVFVTLACMRRRCLRACSDASSDHTSTALVP